MNTFFEQLTTQFGPIIIGTIMISLPLLITAIGGFFSEKSGVINIGLEGMMIFGAFFGTLVLNFVSGLEWYMVLILGLIVAIISSLITGILHAILSIKFQINQVIVGTAINLISPAFVFFLMNSIYGRDETNSISLNSETFQILNGGIVSLEKIVLCLIILLFCFISLFIFGKTKFGKYIIAVGENPIAAATAGLDVIKIRYKAVLISSALAGIGGYAMVVLIGGRMNTTLIAGYGFLALAILIFSGWNIKKCFVGSFIFGLFIALVPSLNTIIGGMQLENSFIKQEDLQGIINLILETGPYIIVILILIIFSNKKTAPKSLGESFEIEKR